jgi:hypothetical protein
MPRKSRAVLALVSDLIFESKITAVAAHLGALVRITKTVDQLRAALRGDDPTAGPERIVLLDLTVDPDACLVLIKEVARAAARDLVWSPSFPMFRPTSPAPLARRARTRCCRARDSSSASPSCSHNRTTRPRGTRIDPRSQTRVNAGDVRWSFR